MEKKLLYGILSEGSKLIKIVLGFAVLLLSSRIRAHLLEAGTKKSLFEIIFLAKLAS